MSSGKTKRDNYFFFTTSSKIPRYVPLLAAMENFSSTRVRALLPMDVLAFPLALLMLFWIVKAITR